MPETNKLERQEIRVQSYEDLVHKAYLFGKANPTVLQGSVYISNQGTEVYFEIPGNDLQKQIAIVTCPSHEVLYQSLKHLEELGYIRGRVFLLRSLIDHIEDKEHKAKQDEEERKAKYKATRNDWIWRGITLAVSIAAIVVSAYVGLSKRNAPTRDEMNNAINSLRQEMNKPTTQP